MAVLAFWVEKEIQNIILIHYLIECFRKQRELKQCQTRRSPTKGNIVNVPQFLQYTEPGLSKTLCTLGFFLYRLQRAAKEKQKKCHKNGEINGGLDLEKPSLLQCHSRTRVRSSRFFFSTLIYIVLYIILEWKSLMFHFTLLLCTGNKIPVIENLGATEVSFFFLKKELLKFLVIGKQFQKLFSFCYRINLTRLIYLIMRLLNSRIFHI